MKKAVLVFAHKDAPLLNILIQQLQAEGETDVYIHLDKKSEDLKKYILANDHVFFIKNNVSVFWGDDTMMKCLFSSWDEIYNIGRGYDYFIMCTGQDLIVRKGLDDFLANNPHKIFLDAKRSDYHNQRYKNFLTHKYPHIVCRDMGNYPRFHPLKILRAAHYNLIKYGIYPQKKLNIDTEGMRFYYSYNWSVMPYYVFCELIQMIQDNPDYRKLYADTYLPEDGFLATMVMKSKYAGEVVWSNESDSQSLTHHSPIYLHPKVYTTAEISEIEASGCFFARKFDTKTDAEVIRYFKDKII